MHLLQDIKQVIKISEHYSRSIRWGTHKKYIYIYTQRSNKEVAACGSEHIRNAFTEA
jgi:hypothetical protein